jgi:putative restriction endonuclease
LKAFVGVTDKDWFNFLASLAGIDEVNFWRPGGGHHF